MSMINVQAELTITLSPESQKLLDRIEAVGALLHAPTIPIEQLSNVDDSKHHDARRATSDALLSWLRYISDGAALALDEMLRFDRRFEKTADLIAAYRRAAK